jgi:hypothetical protein
MKTLIIKTMGDKKDVMDFTCLLETTIGINRIEEMSGVFKSTNKNQYHRYIKIITEADSEPTKENYDALG